MSTDAEWFADRTRLQILLQTQPTWTITDLAQAVGRSASRVKKWRKRIRTAPNDDQVLYSQSRARHHPPSKLEQLVIDRILAIRDHPPEHLQRIPGPKAILYYLQRDPVVRQQGLRLPRSTRTIWQILRAHARIPARGERSHTPVVRPPPMTSWQLDFKDVSSVPADPIGKQQHVVEVLDIVDVGTSILVDAHVRPDKNAFVERYHRTFDQECLRIVQPSDLASAQQVTTTFRKHYNYERPNQAISCGNRPPCVAFADLPARPVLPTQVDPDRWLEVLNGERYVRKVRASGTVSVERSMYYIDQAWAGKYVTLRLDAANRSFMVEYREQPIKQVPIKGLVSEVLPLSTYLELITREARTQTVAGRPMGQQLRLPLEYG
jgi:Integrase core domain